MMRALPVHFFLFLTLRLAEATELKPCTKEQAIRAETGASSLLTWPQVYESYKNFRQCDDGAVGEGYSDSIARLLSEQWNTVDELHRLTYRNKGFERFVLRHVDELMSPTQAEMIRKNAEDHCPSNVRQLCGKVIARLKKTAP
jgi:hypothetical protein